MGVRRKGRVLAFQYIFSLAFKIDKLDNQNSFIDFSWLGDDEKDIKEESLIFAKLLINGVLENLDEIDLKIKENINNWDFDRIGKIDLAILRLSIYSLLYQKEIAAGIVIDEALDISKEYSSTDSYRFINGVLDTIYKKLK